MPRYGQFIHQVYIADGFADDCDELVHRCLSMDKFNFHVFCSVWKELNMGCVYEGRTLGAEIAEVSEELIHIGKHYMLKDTSNFEESAVGVFIVYALLNIQPFEGFAHLRIVPEDLPAINRIEYVARREKRYEVLYALGSILIKGPVQYHAVEREHGMEIAVRKYLEGFTSIDKLGVRPRGVFRRQNDELDILKELDSLTTQYEKAKSSVPGILKLGTNLSYIDVKMASELQSQLLKTISGIHEENYGENHDNGDDILASRRAIKDKAMRDEAKPVKHLVNLNSKKKDDTSNKKKEKESPKKKSKSKIKKDKSPSATAGRKRRITISPRAIMKKSRRRAASEDDEDSVPEIVISDSNDGDDLESVALSERLKAATIAAKTTKAMDLPVVDLESTDDTNTMTFDAENEQELDIEIDTLPVLIRTEDQGKMFEIEIIDNIKERPEPVSQMRPLVKTYKRKESALTKIKAIPGVSLTKITDSTEVTDPVPSTSSANDFASIIEINDKHNNGGKNIGTTVKDLKGLSKLCRKADKRNCKRVHIQSKFKRMGMLPIANFKAPEDVSSNKSDEDTEESSQDSSGLQPTEN